MRSFSDRDLGQKIEEYNEVLDVPDVGRNLMFYHVFVA